MAITWETWNAFGEVTGLDLLYLVRVAKGTTSPNEFRESERHKITGATKHFRKVWVDYGTQKVAGELPGRVVLDHR